MKRACLYALTALLAAPIAAAKSPPIPMPPMLLTFDRDADGGVNIAHVKVRNTQNAPICVSADYDAPARIALVPGAKEIKAKGADAPAKPGCLELAPGGSLDIAYDLRALFPDQPMTAPRICYAVNFRRGGVSEAGDLSLDMGACTTAPKA